MSKNSTWEPGLSQLQLKLCESDNCKIIKRIIYKGGFMSTISKGWPFESMITMLKKV